MKTAVVILNWNGRQLLEQFLPSVVLHSGSQSTIYVADNASTDDSVTYLQTNYPQIKILQNRENGGYAKGYNEALQHIDAEIFVLLNSDVEVTKNWLTPVLEHFKSHLNTAAAQPKILDFHNRDYFEYAGAAGGFIDRYGYPFCRGRIFGTLEKDHNQYDAPAKVFWASGACLFIRKNVFWDLGGFDTDYFAHQEEIDLCWRIHNSGKQIYAIGASRVYHLGGGTLNNSSPKKTYLNFRNSLFNIVKNAPKNQIFRLIFTRLLLDGIAAISFLTQGKGGSFIAILRAHYSFYNMFTTIAKKNRTTKRNANYFYVKSILINYYFKKRKIFNELSTFLHK